MLRRLAVTVTLSCLLTPAAYADAVSLRVPSAGGVVAIGWGEVSGGYWVDPHLGFAVDATLPGTVGISAGTRGHFGRTFGVDFGVAGGPTLDVAVPAVGLQVAPWLTFAYRGPVLLNAGVVLPGTVGLTTFGATWSAPLVMEASAGVALGTVRFGLWGNVGATVQARDWIVDGNAGIWLGIGPDNRRGGDRAKGGGASPPPQ